MIGSLRGTLVSQAPDHVIVDVGGVGYKVLVSRQTLSQLPSSVGVSLFLFVHTSVREDDISLFGFAEEQEKRIFQKLITVNGIGPKLALTILSGIGPQELVQALHGEDLIRLTSISGIGKKTAERMILDLKDKLTEFLYRSSGPPAAGKRKIFEEAVSALVNLGYTRPRAERTLSDVPIPEGVPLESVIRQALRILSEART